MSAAWDLGRSSAIPITPGRGPGGARNMQRQVSLAELARTVGTSARTLARRIKASSGETPQRLVQRMRIAHAVHLLETTRESVEEIATQVGYSDASTFRRIFRKHTGDTPQHWRG